MAKGFRISNFNSASPCESTAAWECKLYISGHGGESMTQRKLAHK